MKRATLIPAAVATVVLLGLAAGVALCPDAATAAHREARALNGRLHRWLVQSGAMRCDACGPPRKFDVCRFLRGW